MDLSLIIRFVIFSKQYIHWSSNTLTQISTKYNEFWNNKVIITYSKIKIKDKWGMVFCQQAAFNYNQQLWSYNIRGDLFRQQTKPHVKTNHWRQYCVILSCLVIKLSWLAMESKCNVQGHIFKYRRRLSNSTRTLVAPPEWTTRKLKREQKYNNTKYNLLALNRLLKHRLIQTLNIQHNV